MKTLLTIERWKLAYKYPLLTLYGIYRKMFLYITRPISNLLKDILLSHYYIFGGGRNNKRRLHISQSAVINNAFLNVHSGDIFIEDYVFFGHGVSIITGTHDYEKFDLERILSYPALGNDIVIKKGVWIGAGAIILGPCVIDEYSVIAAGAVVTKNIGAYEIWGGVPAKKIKDITHSNK